MKINKIFTFATVSALSLGFSACIDDESTYGDVAVLPTITVATGTDAGEVPVVNNYIGSETVIEPKIEYTGSGQLSYEWSIPSDAVSRASYEVVSTEPVFRYTFTQGGAYTVILKISDGTVGFSQEYEVSVNRPFEKGYLLLSNNNAGKGNLVFLKDMTPEELDEGMEPVVLEDVFSRILPTPCDEKLVDVKIFRPTWPMNARFRLMVTTTGHCFYLDPNTFTVVTNIDFDKNIPGFKADFFIPMAAEGVVRDNATGRFLTLKAEDMFAAEETAWKGTQIDDVAVHSYVSNGGTTWETYSYENAYLQYSPLKVCNRGYSYDVGDYVVNPAEDMVDDEFINVFGAPKKNVVIDDPYYGPYTSTERPFYFFTRSKSTGDIYWTSYYNFGPYASDPPMLDGRKVVGNASSAIPAVGSTGAASNKFSRCYYYNGNHVYVLVEGTDGVNSLPSPSQWALEFPSNEEITYIGIDDASVTGDEILVVATADTATGRGNVYFYDPRNVRTDAPGATPFKTYRNCADRISQVFYKPRK